MPSRRARAAVSDNEQDSSLASFLAKPEAMANLRPDQWSSVIAMARQTGLLARLAYRAQDLSLEGRIPANVWRHLEAAQRVGEKHRRDVLWEIRCLRRALKGVVTPLVLLKGAAYLVADLPPARGRTFSDIDILVPKSSLPEVEQALRANGWASDNIKSYDDRYYRRWMHQLPPLTHAERGTTVDVHHTIVPVTARAPVDAAALLSEVRMLSSDPGLAVLQPTDMVLHSAVHLFNEGQFERALRDLDDIASLLTEFGRDPCFWPMLAARARELQLGRPLWYAVEMCRRLFQTAVPGDSLLTIGAAAPAAPLRAIMYWLFDRALEPLSGGGGQGAALFALYVRAHYLRMPLYRLLPHLIRKSLRRETPEENPAQA
jgi:hypothetical protein